MIALKFWNESDLKIKEPFVLKLLVLKNLLIIRLIKGISHHILITLHYFYSKILDYRFS